MTQARKWSERINKLREVHSTLLTPDNRALWKDLLHDLEIEATQPAGSPGETVYLLGDGSFFRWTIDPNSGEIGEASEVK
jgi:hypothetical protein